MFVFMTVFSLAAIFDLQTPIHKSDYKATQSDKVVSDTSDQDKKINIQSFSNDDNKTGQGEDNPSTFPNELTSDKNNTDSNITDDTLITPPLNTPEVTEAPTAAPPLPTSSPTPTPTQVPKQKYANLGISIAKDYVNIRKSPSTDSESLGKLYRNSAAEVIKTKGDWYYVESGTVKGYIKRELLKTGLSDDILIKKYGTPMVSVDVDGLNVRVEPSMDSKKITTVYKDETYPIISSKDDWYQIDLPDEKVNGYVKKEYVELEAEFKLAISKKQEEKVKQIKAEKRLKKETEVKHGSGVDYTKEDLKLLACLIQAEAGHQSYECKLAVANVVLNRVKLHKASFQSIIYAPGQFSVAKSGSLQKQLDRFDGFDSQAEQLTIKAAKDALAGSNNIGNRRYFHSYRAAVNKGYDKKDTAVKLGGLVFW